MAVLICSLVELWVHRGISAMFLLFLIFRPIMRIKIRTGGYKKTDFQFFFSLQNKNVDQPTDQPIKN